MKKKYTIKALCLAVALFVCGTNLQAQTALETSFYLNGIAPMGEFGKSASLNADNLLGKDQIGTAAALGFGVGARASLPFDIGVGYVAPFVNVDVLWNQVKSSLREAYAINQAGAPNYFNIPIMLGVQYRHPMDQYGLQYLVPFAEFSVGYNLFKAGSEGWKNSETDPYNVYRANGTMAWQVGVGSFFGSHVSAGLHYYGLGRHSITYSDRSHGYNNLDASVQRRTVGTLMLRIGFHF